VQVTKRPGTASGEARYRSGIYIKYRIEIDQVQIRTDCVQIRDRAGGTHQEDITYRLW
jgi:hypothetical protein